MQTEKQANELQDIVDFVKEKSGAWGVAIIGRESHLTTIKELLSKINDAKIVEVPNHIRSLQNNDAIYIIPINKE